MELNPLATAGCTTVPDRSRELTPSPPWLPTHRGGRWPPSSGETTLSRLRLCTDLAVSACCPPPPNEDDASWWDAVGVGTVWDAPRVYCCCNCCCDKNCCCDNCWHCCCDVAGTEVCFASVSGFAAALKPAITHSVHERSSASCVSAAGPPPSLPGMGIFWVGVGPLFVSVVGGLCQCLSPHRHIRSGLQQCLFMIPRRRGPHGL